MINSIKCIKLKSIQPNKTLVDFSKENVPEQEADLHLTITNEFSLNDSEETKRCKITFSAEAYGAVADQDSFTTLQFSVDYIFDIIDEDTYSKLSEDYLSCLCSNIVFMDYRRRLLITMSNASMNGIKLPLSLQDLIE